MTAVILVGGGGHGRVLLEALRRSGVIVAGVVDRDPAAAARLGLPGLGDDAAFLASAQPGALLVNGIGGMADTGLRRAVFERFLAAGFRFATVIHPSAVVAEDVALGDGAQVMAGVVIQPGSRIGANAILNTRCVVDHDCVIGAHAHIAPGAVLAGGVEVGAGAVVGTGASVRPLMRIGEGSVVGAGAAVVAMVPAHHVAVGVPARAVSKSRTEDR